MDKEIVLGIDVDARGAVKAAIYALYALHDQLVADGGLRRGATAKRIRALQLPEGYEGVAASLEAMAVNLEKGAFADFDSSPQFN